jgi:hypothetical protein
VGPLLAHRLECVCDATPRAGGGNYLAVLCVLAVIGTFAFLQWTGSGRYAQAATRCFGVSLGVLSLVDVGIVCRRSFKSSPLLVAGDALVQYGRSPPRRALVSLLAALLGLLVVFLAQTGRQLRRKPRWYTTPLAGDPQLRCQCRRAGDASLIFGCLLVYFDLWMRHQETLLRQSSPELWDFLIARVKLELPYDAIVAGFTVALLLYASLVAIRTRRRVNHVSGQDAGTDRLSAPPGVA